MESDLESSNKWNELLQVFEEQENGLQEEIIELRTKLEEIRREKEDDVN